MSGGSYNYVYNQIEEALGEVRRRHADSPPHLALTALMQMVADAMHDIEWVDSADYGKGDDLDAIRRCVTPTQELEAATSSEREALKMLEAALARVP